MEMKNTMMLMKNAAKGMEKAMMEMEKVMMGIKKAMMGLPFDECRVRGATGRENEANGGGCLAIGWTPVAENGQGWP
ncbi:hypothetical protein CRG98_004381 [Punica granatum]|uniref:Uncharacterized protein n=1 Tax=Punica granatum TaxID=22663 RepID=A0A2I0L3N2_PUNGR|nr:hypothetical protein CRG98_004381 [Punica granatum]